MKALVGAFNKQKALVGASLGTVKLREFSLAALLSCDHGPDIVDVELVAGVVVLVHGGLGDGVGLHALRQLQRQVGVTQHHLELRQAALEQAETKFSRFQL